MIEVVPSPKSHSQEVGFPLEKSMNRTSCSGDGEVGVYIKDI
jgi:hypothetical protein